MDYSRWTIAEFTHWTAGLNARDPNYLGRCVIALRRGESDGIYDLMDSRVTQEERDELFSAGQLLCQALKELFEPIRFNYSALGNEGGPLHLHVVPRYSGERVFEGICFTDPDPGRNYAPYDKEFTVPEEILLRLRDVIASQIASLRS